MSVKPCLFEAQVAGKETGSLALPNTVCLEMLAMPKRGSSGILNFRSTHRIGAAANFSPQPQGFSDISKGMMMTDFTTAKMLFHRRNIQRYGRLLATELTDLERQYAKRIAEEHAQLESLAVRESAPSLRPDAFRIFAGASRPSLNPAPRGIPGVEMMLSIGPSRRLRG